VIDSNMAIPFAEKLSKFIVDQSSTDKKVFGPSWTDLHSVQQQHPSATPTKNAFENAWWKQRRQELLQVAQKEVRTSL
jgi:hypothetical protein